MGARKSLSNPIGSDSVSELVWRRSAAAARIPPGPKFSCQVQFFFAGNSEICLFMKSKEDKEDKMHPLFFYTDIFAKSPHFNPPPGTSQVKDCISHQYSVLNGEAKAVRERCSGANIFVFVETNKIFINFSRNEDLSGLKVILCKRRGGIGALLFIFDLFHHEGNTLSVSTFQLRLQR